VSRPCGTVAEQVDDEKAGGVVLGPTRHPRCRAAFGLHVLDGALEDAGELISAVGSCREVDDVSGLGHCGTSHSLEFDLAAATEEQASKGDAMLLAAATDRRDRQGSSRPRM
jgi:hypothetical protein